MTSHPPTPLCPRMTLNADYPPYCFGYSYLQWFFKRMLVKCAYKEKTVVVQWPNWVSVQFGGEWKTGMRV